MKIGILTFYDGINHGAYLQAYSLLYYLLSKGYQAEIINYKNNVHFKNENIFVSKILKKNLNIIAIINILFNLKIYFIKFQNLRKVCKFRKSKKLLTKLKVVTDRSEVNISKYDIVIVGSDIVWDYSYDPTGHDTVYFADGLKNKKIISYAASCGDADLNDIPQYVILGLQKFTKISVRDYGTKQLVFKTLGLQPAIVADPVLLFNFPKFKNKSKDPYILVYAYRLTPEEIEKIIVFSVRNRIKTISIGYYNSWCDKNIIALDPFEWVGYFQHSRYVVTSTFHGTIFAIKYNKEFATSINSHICNKLSFILDYLGLTDRITENKDIIKIFEEKINYENINILLLKLIENSKNYLEDILK
jgi:hypothetical protein